MKCFHTFLLLMLLASCITPDTQPVIDGVLEWKKLEDAELQKHRDIAGVAKFSEDLVQNAEYKAAYQSLIDKHGRVVDGISNALINWAQRVGEFDETYANKTLDQMIDVYLKIKEEVEK